MKSLNPLAILFLCVSIALAATPPTRHLGVEEFDTLRREKGAVVLDVRTAKEFKAGHLAGATNLDWNSNDFDSAAARLDRSKTYLVHCAAGVRSAKACRKLEELGFTNLVNLAPGLKGWEKAGKPVEK